MFPDVVYRRGLEYFQSGRVNELLYDLNYEVWTARVAGTENYFVEINMQGFDKGAIEAYCDCAAFDTFGSCKHIVAVLLSIQENEAKKGNKQADYDYNLTNRFIQMFSGAAQADHSSKILDEKAPIQVEYRLKWDYAQNMRIEMKFGESRRYVVKDAENLLWSVLNGEGYFFTKNFSYNPEEHFIVKEDMDIFEMLYTIQKSESIYHSTFYHRFASQDKRDILIPPLMAKELLEKLAERDCSVAIADQAYEMVKIEKNELPFEFLLEKNDQDDVTLKLTEGNETTFLSDYDIIFSNGTFYYLTAEQLGIIKGLKQFNLNYIELAISNKQADQFFSEVIPSLKTVGEVKVDEKIIEEVIQVPLQAKMYLEMNEEVITGKLEYHYGKQVIDPFSGRDKHDVIIIRDVEKEQRIMELIERANFHYNGKELYLETYEEDELYVFLYYVLPLLAENVELFLTSDLKSMVIEHEPAATTNVALDTASNLLEISFDIEGLDEDEVDKVIRAVIEKKKFYRLQSGAVLSLETDSFSSINQLFSDMELKRKDFESGKVQMPVHRGTQIDELIDTKRSYDLEFRTLLHRLRSPEEQVYELPENLQATLRNYQITGYQWFKSLSEYYLGGILADDMGLGKTIQTIAYIASEPSNKLHLVVAPSSVVYNWKNEFDKFAPHLETAVLTGTPAEREEKIKTLKHIDVWITSYTTLRQDIDFYKEMEFQSVILDEAQYIKNYATKTSQAMRQITASRRFALSGTPIENTVEELWSIFQVVLPGMMPSRKNFKQLSNEKIASITRPFILRRLKRDVLKELPEKIESVSVSELTQEQKELYVGYLRQVQREASESIKGSGFNQSRIKILAGLTRLRQICCHPSLFIENYAGESGKLLQLMETVKTALENKKRLLIFSQFTSMHELIIKELQKEGIDYFYLSGSTGSEERLNMSERFNQGEKDVFLISLRAGGTGLNLTGADTVILYDLWWNPAIEDQATGRAHRFGQKNVVQVIRMLAEGTIEEKIYELQQKKRELISQVIQPGETMLTSLSEDDIRELLSL